MRVAVVVIASFASSIAYADDTLADARRLEASLEYEKALVVADRAIAAGGNSVPDLVELELLAGRVAAGLDKPDIARDHFARALEIDHSAGLFAGTSPKLTEPFAAARAASAPLTTTIAVLDRVVRVTIDVDRLGLASALRVQVIDRAGARDQVVRFVDSTDGRRAIDVRIDDDARAPSAEVVDEHGNALQVMLLDVSAAKRATAPAAAPLYARWSTWAVTSAAALGAAGICAWQFGVAQSDWNRASAGGHDYSELTAIEDRGRHWGIAADIGFGVATAAGIAAIVLYLRGDTSGVAIAPNGAAVTAHF